MRVRDPLRGRRAQARNEGHERADRAGAQDEAPVPKRVADAFAHAAHNRLMSPSDAASLRGQLDELGNRIEPDGDRDEPDAVPEKETAERVALRAGDRIETDRGE